MGISYGMLKSKKLVNEEIRFIYYLQLFVNAMWSIIFFVLKWRLFAFIWIILLDILVIVMISEFYLSFFFLYIINNKKYGIIYFIIKSGRLLWQK